MQHLEVSCAVRPIQWPLGVKWLTNSKYQNPSEEANSSSAGRESPRILWKSEVHYRIHKSTSPVPILSQINSPCPTSHFFNIYFNIILTSTPGSTKRPFSLGFPHQNSVCTSPLPHICPRPMPGPFYSSSFNLSNNIWWVQTMTLLITQSSTFSCYLALLVPKYLPQNPIFQHPEPVLLSQMVRPSFTPTQNKRQNYNSVFSKYQIGAQFF